ncbi:MAG: hypothetical protein ABI596_05275 [Pyrinomonadaceae bacterium]
MAVPCKGEFPIADSQAGEVHRACGCHIEDAVIAPEIPSYGQVVRAGAGDRHVGDQGGQCLCQVDGTSATAAIRVGRRDEKVDAVVAWVKVGGLNHGSQGAFARAVVAEVARTNQASVSGAIDGVCQATNLRRKRHGTRMSACKRREARRQLAA